MTPTNHQLIAQALRAAKPGPSADPAFHRQWRLCAHSIALALLHQSPQTFDPKQFYDTAGWPERYGVPSAPQPINHLL